jgi:hypothetical protein
MKQQGNLQLMKRWPPGHHAKTRTTQKVGTMQKVGTPQICPVKKQLHTQQRPVRQ